MAFFARNLAAFKKLKPSCNDLNLYTNICTSYQLRYNYIQNAVAHGSNYTFYEKKVSVDSTQNFNIRNKSTGAKNEQTSKKFAPYVQIQLAYGELYNELCFKDIDSELEKMVKYILSKNIRINDWNMKYSQYNSVISMGARRKKSGVNYCRFTPHEDDVIKNKWDDLCCDCGIENSIDLSRKLLTNVNSKNVLERKILNVIGCYLDPDLKKERHATEVIHRAICILNNFVTGKFKSKEDKIILQEVQRNGDNTEVYKDLCMKLNRNPIQWHALRIRYETLIYDKDFNFGKWTIDEDKFIIDTLFMNKELGISGIHSINYSDYKNFQQIKRKPSQVKPHYEIFIKPILLKYHYGKLGYNSKYDFMRYVVENKIKSVKEIQWKEVLKLFPYETVHSLTHDVTSIFRYHKKSPLDDLYLVFQEYIKCHDEKQPSEDKIEYQNNIVEIYLNCKK